MWSVNDVSSLDGNHDEADMRIAFHLWNINEYNPGNTIVRGNDTDLAIVMCANVQLFNNIHVWFDVGVDSLDTRRYIDMSLVRNEIEHIDATVAMYTFTGCDYSPAFNKKGKTRPVELMLRDEKFIEAFTKLGESSSITAEMINAIEEFTCLMYGHKKCTEINKAGYSTFCAKYKPSLNAKPLAAIKSIEPTLFPPCQSVLIGHIKRSFYISTLYKNASLPDPSCGLNPLDYGWDMDAPGTLMIRWFEGDQVPGEVEDLVNDVNIEIDDDLNDEESEEEDGDDGNSDYHLL